MSVVDQLSVAGNQPLAAKAKKKRKSILQFELTAKKVPRKDLMHFSRQLAVFVQAGIPILDALEAIEEEMGNKLLRSILSEARAELSQGKTFADALGKNGSALPPYYLGILRAAELTGRLDTVLVQLSTYIERDLEARRKISSALAYPAVIMATALVVVVVLVSYVLPKFQVFFANLDATLPLPTRILLGAADAVASNLLVIGAGTAVAIFGLMLVNQSKAGRRFRDALILRMPIAGDLATHIILERFCRILSAMMAAGVQLPEALRVTSEATNNATYRKALTEVNAAMLRGEGLATPLIATGLFPAAAKQMFRVGERTGSLDAQLATAAGYFDRELDYKIKRFTTLFEPAVLIFVGLVVGFVAIALVSAMYGIFGQTRSL